MEKSQGRINGWLIALGLPVVAIVLIFCVGRFFYKPYYIPSESMMPTFEIGDQFLVDTRGGHPLHIGDIVVVRWRDSVRIVRVVARGGDRVEVRLGVPVINGIAAQQRAAGSVTYGGSGTEGSVTAQRLAERLPGEPGTHHILDIEQGYSDGDNFAEVRVPAGHLFLLGDNRDRAADSRFTADAMGGLGMPAESDVVGTAALIWAAHDSARAWKKPR
jgi:signal peptidase I